MGKIGILTFHRSVNNGAVMQAYSLSHRLSLEYPDMDVEVIDYHMPKVADSYHYTFRNSIQRGSPVTVLKSVAKLMLHPGQIRRLNKRTEVFEGVRDCLPLSERTIVEDTTEGLFQYINETYDVLIVGSDAVWNYVTRGFPNAYFPDRRILCPKLSYAASCYGMEYASFAEDNREKIHEILDDFSFIGVRDTATENFVRWSRCGVEPQHTCDPTAFLDISSLPVDGELLVQKLKKRKFDFNRPTIGIMGTDKMCAMVRKMYGKTYQIAALYNYLPQADVNLYDLTPYEWAYAFRYFQLVFTTYFHGTMLSLRNGVPLICIALPTEFAKRHTPKTLDVLQRLGYEDWYFSTDYRGMNFEQIKEKADELLHADLKREILSRIDHEAESYGTFKRALNQILTGENKHD